MHTKEKGIIKEQREDRKYLSQEQDWDWISLSSFLQAYSHNSSQGYPIKKEALGQKALSFFLSFEGLKSISK